MAETTVGGRYVGEDGRLHDAEGRVIEETLVGVVGGGEEILVSVVGDAAGAEDAVEPGAPPRKRRVK